MDPGLPQAGPILYAIYREVRPMRPFGTLKNSRHGITVLGLLLLVIALAVAAVLLMRYLGSPAATP